MVYLILLGLMPAVQAEPGNIWESCEIALEKIAENKRSIAERIQQIPDDGITVQQFDAEIVDPAMVLEPLPESACPDVPAAEMPRKLLRQFKDRLVGEFSLETEVSELIIQLHSEVQMTLDAKFESTIRAKRNKIIEENSR